MHKNTTSLIILDGFGVGPEGRGNAQSKESMPFYHSLLKQYSSTTLEASGTPVGLPDGVMGNSEVGHLTLGAGRVLKQSLVQINDDITSNAFHTKKAFVDAIRHAEQHGTPIHLMGLLSDGGVHASINHLFALLDICANSAVNTYIHVFLDGRDTPPYSAREYISQLQAKIKNVKNIHISTMSGRFYAMDRDRRWDRIQLAYETITGMRKNIFDSAEEALEESYVHNITDEFVMPRIIDCHDNAQFIDDHHAVIFFNFRTDRTKELTAAFIQDSFTGFPRVKKKDLFFTTMTEYDPDFNKAHVAYPKEHPQNTLPVWLSTHQKTQFHTAETEKYAHVTYFFNGGIEKPVPGEERKVISSPKVTTYDIAPKMSAVEVNNATIEALTSKKYDFVVVNFANPDMVGHTGNMKATIHALQTVDNCLKDLVKTIVDNNQQAIITADHGNCEHMIQKDGTADTAHTTNKVPCILISKTSHLQQGASLADVAPTILDIMNIPIPKEMTGSSLIKKSPQM